MIDLSLLQEAKDLNKRVNITLNNGTVYSNLLVFEIIKPHVCQVEIKGKVSKPLLSTIIRFSTDGECAALGVTLRKLKGVTYVC